VELYLHCPKTPSWRGAQLKHRDNFTFHLYYRRGEASLIEKYLKKIQTRKKDTNTTDGKADILFHNKL
jgi:hypothetical protein